MASSPDAAKQTMIDNLPEKTGKSLDQWMATLSKQSFEKHGEIVKWLKGEHGITHGFANLIAHSQMGNWTGKNPSSGVADDDLISAQYSGAKADLKPIYDKVIKMISAFGNDIEIAPKKAYVSLRRSKQFALVQPSTKDRVDVGIKLKDHDTTDRLEASGSFNSMVTHRVRVTSAKDINAELKAWLKKAYDAA